MMRALREAAGKTQVVAQASQIDQADISRLESRESLEDCQVSTLQRYVAALGGRLELVAAFGKQEDHPNRRSRRRPAPDRARDKWGQWGRRGLILVQPGDTVFGVKAVAG